MRAASDAEPVSRILYGVAAADGHSSRPSIAERLKRPTRKFGASSRDALATACALANSFPIWSCSVWGLPCLAHYCASGALLPHLFTLTATVEHLRLWRACACLAFASGSKVDRLSPFTSIQGFRNGLRLLHPRVRFEQNGSHRSLTRPAAVYFLWHFP